MFEIVVPTKDDFPVDHTNLDIKGDNGNYFYVAL